MDQPPRKRVSLIVPCCNEAGVLDAFLARVNAVRAGLGAYTFEVLFIEDGSTDDTWAALCAVAALDPSVRAVRLSRNFGHQRALAAGLDFCTGDYGIILDADLQDPPELIPVILEQLEAGADVVHTVRTDRRVDSAFKRLSAAFMYAFLRRWVLPELPRNAGLYKGFNARALGALRQYRERVRFLRGIFATLGFRQAVVPYARETRRGGQTKYHLRNMVRLARDAVVSNSVLPLRAGLYLGLAVLVAWPVLAAAGLLRWYAGRLETPALWAVAGLVWGFGGLTLVMLGAVGEYLKCIVLEVKQRPLYIVEETRNLPETDVEPRAAAPGSGSPGRGAHSGEGDAGE